MLDFLAGVPGKLKTLVDRLTSTRAANLDKLDAYVSSRAAASTAVSNADLTAARIAKLDNLDAAISTRMASSASIINSIQRVSGVCDAIGSKIFTITTVDLSKTIIIPASGTGGGYGFATSSNWLWGFMSASSVGFFSGSDMAGKTVSAFVVEFK